MAARSYIATLLVAGGLLTAAVHYSPAPSPAAGFSESKLETSAKKTAAHTPSETPAATSDATGVADATMTLHDQLCAAVYGSGDSRRHCPLDPDSAAPAPAAGQPAASAPDAEAVIAIFPDPIHTHLSLRFDRNVDALIAAAQDAGWYFDRQWLPWTWMGAGMGAGTGANAQAGEPGDDKDLPELVKTRSYRHGFESIPGFISFRPIEGKQHRKLVVFIVGDSPISGILPEQFLNAYKDTVALDPGARELRILGPSFTGSISSLGALLSSATHPAGKDAAPTRPIRIISPTISRDLAHVVLAGDAGPVLPKPSFTSYGMSLNCRIRSVAAFVQRQTEQDDERIVQGEPRLGQEARIALLSEDESAFGRVANQPETDRGGDCDLSKTDLLRLTFPRDISHLRNAYQKKSIWGFGSSSNGGTSLGLDFTDPHEELDAVPNFSYGQNAASLETTMHQLAETLTERDIRVVLLSATDVFDELFLARILGRLAPNLSVVVLDSDALFLHQGGGDTYNHVFVASPFPSLPLNLFWSAPANLLRDEQCSPRLFPSESAEGAYLAAGSLLVDRMPDRKTDRHNDRRRTLPFARQQFCTTQYSSPFEATERPPLWLISIEHGHQWPLATLDLENEAPANVPSIRLPATEEDRAVTGLRKRHIPVALWLGLFALLALAAAHVYGSAVVTIRSTLLWDYAISDLATQRTRLALQLALTLIAIVAIRFLLPPDLPNLVHHSFAFLALAGCAIFALAALAALQAACLVADTSLAVALETVASMKARLFSPAALIAAVVAVAAAIAVSLLPWGLLTIVPGGRVEFFERYRALYPFSGIAPTLPVLLLLCALALGVMSRLGRLYFAGPWRPVLPSTTTDPDLLRSMRLPSQESVAPLHIFLADWKSSASLARGGTATTRFFSRLSARPESIWAIVFAVLLMGHASLAWAAPATLDGHPYTVMLKSLGGAIIALLCFDLVRAWRLWRLLRVNVLRPLERTPLRRGFDRIKGMSWERIWRTMDSSPEFSYHPARRALELATSDEARLGLLAAGNTTLSDTWRLLGAPQAAELFAENWGRMLSQLTAAAEAILPGMVATWAAEAGGVTSKDDVIAERSKELLQAPEIHAPTGTGFRPAASALLRGRAHATTPAVSPIRPDLLPAQEEFVALIYLQYVRIVLIQIRHSLFTAAASYVLLAAALTQYPIVGRHAVEIGLLLLFLFLATVSITVYAAIHRDSILSRTTESEPGKLDMDFYLKIAGYLGLPLLGLLASQFPELSSTVFSWLPGTGAGK